jgi:hypothetical protein
MKILKMSGGTEFIAHYTVSRTPMTRKRLRYLDVLCISLFNIHGLRVLPIAIFLFFVPLLNKSNEKKCSRMTDRSHC